MVPGFAIDVPNDAKSFTATLTKQNVGQIRFVLTVPGKDQPIPVSATDNLTDEDGQVVVAIPAAYHGKDGIGLGYQAADGSSLREDAVVLVGFSSKSPADALGMPWSSLQPIKDFQGNIDATNPGIATCRWKRWRNADGSWCSIADGIALPKQS